ncbi:hypothetical protein U1Q18_027369 [Sarracenia purpurea var. burkii]
MPVASESDAVSPCNGSRVPPFKRSYNHSEGMGGIFHRGVRCDGCGAYPITGPRFKSKVKEDYDLCSICFVEMGNRADYIRMDRPVAYRCPYLSKGFTISIKREWDKTKSTKAAQSLHYGCQCPGWYYYGSIHSIYQDLADAEQWYSCVAPGNPACVDRGR